MTTYQKLWFSIASLVYPRVTWFNEWFNKWSNDDHGKKVTTCETLVLLSLINFSLHVVKVMENWETYAWGIEHFISQKNPIRSTDEKTREIYPRYCSTVAMKNGRIMNLLYKSVIPRAMTGYVICIPMGYPKPLVFPVENEDSGLMFESWPSMKKWSHQKPGKLEFDPSIANVGFDLWNQ